MSAVASTRMSDQNDKIVPVRMKKKTLKKLTNAEKLEVENKKMEERLRTLRQTIEKEKSERSKMGENAPIWQSGKEGAVQNHAKDHMAKNKNKAERALKGDKKIRVKFLTPDKPPPKQAVEPTPPARVSTPHNTYQQEGAGGNWAVQQFSQDEARPSTPRTQRQEQPAEYNNLVHAVVPTCGQCEEVAANLNCVECGEKYCEHCFASFHRKGALKTHRTRPLTRQAGNTVVRESTFISNEPVIREEYRSKPMNEARNSKPGKPIENSLWGDYNEDDSAQSFKAAVNQWRGGETVITTTGGQMKHSQQADGCQTAFTAMPEICFKENENLSYFDRILLKKCKDLEFDQHSETSRDLPSRQYSQHTDSPGELTISQLDYFNEFRNIEAEPKEEQARSSSVMIEEVTYNAGGLEEESNCVVEEDVEETRDQEEEVPVTPYNTTVTIEELITPAPAEQTTPVLRDAFYSPVTSPSTVGVFTSHMPLVSKKSMQSVTSSLEPQPASPRCVTPPRDDRITVQSMSPQSYTEADELSQRYTDTPISPLKRRMPTNPSIERQHSQAGPTFSSSGPQKHSFYNNRPATADVVILSSQAWKQSFFGFLNAGLPGYTLPQSPTPSTVLEEEPVMLEGPPIWCPGESETTNEQFTPRENSIAFSLTEGMSGVKEELNSSTDTVDLQLDTKDEDNDEDQEALAALTLEHQASSLDLTEQLEELREGTPNPLSLLTHDDRMTQLDMEARGISPTSTPILTKLTVRQSLFEDFEEMEKQCMAGEVEGDEQEEEIVSPEISG